MPNSNTDRFIPAEVLGPTVFDAFFGEVNDFRTLIKQRVIVLLFTRPGELWDSNFGVGLDAFLFEQMTPTVTNEIESRITNQFSVYFPYLTLFNASVTPFPDDSAIVINLTFSIPGFEDEIALDMIFEPFNGIMPRFNETGIQELQNRGKLNASDLGQAQFFYTETGILGLFSDGLPFNPYLP